MSPSIHDLLAAAPIVPLVQADDPATAVRVARALSAGGLSVVEVVLRTDEALDCMRAIVHALPGVMTGAGTVLNAGQATAALASGAGFIVSPGLDAGVVEVAKDAGVPVFPGIVTPTELQRAFNLGLDTVKFFPASIAGGVPAIRALAGVFRTMKFMPTGGVDAQNLADFLRVPAVVACGGSWLTPKDAIARGDYETVTALAREAVAIADAVRQG